MGAQCFNLWNSKDMCNINMHYRFWCTCNISILNARGRIGLFEYMEEVLDVGNRPSAITSLLGGGKCVLIGI